MMSSRVSSQVVKDSTALSADFGAEAETNTSMHRSKHIFSRSVRGLIGALIVMIAFYNVNEAFALVVLVAFFAVPASIAVKLMNTNRQIDCSNYDSIIEEVALKVHEGSKTNSSQSQLETPLLEVQAETGPPSLGVYHMEDNKFGITDKKTGDRFLRNSSTQSVARLTFEISETGWSIGGSRTCNNSPALTIEKGFVAANTKAAYWVETDGKVVRRIVTGQFDATFLGFNGEWMSSMGDRGSLTMLEEPCNIVGVDYAVPLEDNLVAEVEATSSAEPSVV